MFDDLDAARRCLLWYDLDGLIPMIIYDTQEDRVMGYNEAEDIPTTSHNWQEDGF